MKYLLASGALAAAIAAAGTAARAQPVENTRPPLFSSAQDYYGDASQTAPSAAAGAGSRERRPWYGTDMYDSHSPAGNSARWGVGG